LRSTQVIEAHDECLTKILRFSFIERLRPLTAIGIISRSCSHFCESIDKALVTCCGASTGVSLTKENLLAIANNPSFARAVQDSDASFNKVRTSLECGHPLLHSGMPCESAPLFVLFTPLIERAAGDAVGRD
jgi:hypothetical protein